MGVFGTDRWIGVRLAALAVLAGCAMPAAEPPRAFPEVGARLEATVYLSERGPDRGDAVFRYPAVAGGETRIGIASTARRPFAARLVCTGPARLLAPGEIGPGLYLGPGGLRAVQVPAAGAARLPVLVLPAGTQACDIRWGQGLRLPLRREGAPAAVAPAAIPACAVPYPLPADPLARAFFAERAMSMTCAAPAGPVELVPGEIEALKWRLDRLTGADVSATRIKEGDPDMALDFSRAPRFDEIIVSYLLIRADLSGWLMTRALAFHAARGTRIRVLASSSLMLPFDRRPFEALASQYPNVSLQYFQFPATGPGEVLNSLQRANHVKLFLGLSPDPGRSFALVGGRNLTDGFYLDGQTNYPDHPFLHSYFEEVDGVQGLAFHSVYDDFEVAVTERARVAEIARQFARFYTRDAREQTMRLATASAPGEPAGGTGLVRHFISLPWADGWAHEALYADLFDAARSEIFVVSPFNYPSPAIEAALDRAAARGVDVRFVTRRGADEPPAAFTRALNARFNDEAADRYRFRLHDTGLRLLHAKIIVIDGRLGVVASSNLNRRSYIHDTENGLMFLDPGVAGRLRAEAERYWAMSGTEDDKNAYTLPLALFAAIPWLEQFF